MSLQIDLMAELDDTKTQGSKPRTPSSPTVEQLFQAGEASKCSPNASPTLRKDCELDPDHAHRRKSLLTKVKEKARKLQHSLSHKKKHSEEDITPSWGVRLEDYEVEDEQGDPEYLGAPMYESEMAPEELKETARQHPRAEPVISETHVLSIAAKYGVEQEKDRPTSPNKTIGEMLSEKLVASAKEKQSNPNKKATETVSKKLPPGNAEEKPTSPHKTITETVSEKLAPEYATVSDVTHAITSKIQGLAFSAPAAHETDKDVISETNKHVTAGHNNLVGSEITDVNYGERVWDRGVSVKEYIMQKLEPGEDEKALAQVISEAMSPSKGSDDSGVVGRVKGAVSSLIWNEESKYPRATKSAPSSPLKIPVSTNAHEVFEEENHGRILQAN